MVNASELADWWDVQHRQYQELLGQFVENNPNVFSVGLATLLTLPTELGAGLVDTLRLGKGAAEGGWGWGQDALRLLGIAGPVGRITKYLGFGVARRIGIYMADLARSAGICTWVATAKALRHTGAGTLFAKVDDLAAAMGHTVPPAGLPSVWAQDLVLAIRSLGGKATSLGLPQSIQHVKDVAKGLRENEALLFAVEWSKGGHTLYAFKDFLGRVRFSDRTGHVVKELAEYERLVPGFAGIGQATVMTRGSLGQMLKIEGAKMMYIDAAQRLSALMIPVVRLTALNTDEVTDLADLKRRFEEFRHLKTTPNRWTVTTTKLPPVEYLTGVQTRLKEMGHYRGAVHGKHDAASRQATIDFQRKYGLVPDGIPGPKTQAKLKQVFGA